MTTKHPLSAPLEAGGQLLDCLGLATEAKIALDAAEHDGLASLIHSAHAPFSLGSKRLNVACTDDAWRQQSIDIQRDYIRGCRRFPKVRKVICHIAPSVWYDSTGAPEQEGDYDRLIDALKGHAQFAADLGMEVTLENNRTYYHHQMDKAPADANGVSVCQYFGALPEEWLQIVKDVACGNFSGCLDTSHACTTTHRFSSDHRADVLMRFLAEPDLIGHVHWNGNDLYDDQGRDDRHRPIDEGGLPGECHRTIAGLDATLHLEHWFDASVLERELNFVETL